MNKLTYFRPIDKAIIDHNNTSLFFLKPNIKDHIPLEYVCCWVFI